MKYAYIRLDVIAAASSEGRLAGEKVKALNDQKVRELNDRNKALQAAQQKLEQGGAVLNEAARGQLQAEVERQQRDLQRFTEDAQQDVQAIGSQSLDASEEQFAELIRRSSKVREILKWKGKTIYLLLPAATRPAVVLLLDCNQFYFTYQERGGPNDKPGRVVSMALPFVEISFQHGEPQGNALMIITR